MHLTLLSRFGSIILIREIDKVNEMQINFCLHSVSVRFPPFSHSFLSRGTGLYLG